MPDPSLTAPEAHQTSGELPSGTQSVTRWHRKDEPRTFITWPPGVTPGPSITTFKVRQKSFYAQ